MAAGLVVVLIAGAVGYVLTRSNTAKPTGPQPQALALSLTEGRRLEYRLDATVLGTTSVGIGASKQEQRLTQNLELGVSSVHPSGLATVQLRTARSRFEMDGRRFRQDPLSLRIQITPDGRVLTGANLGITTGEVGGPGIPGMDQLVPVLPDRPVVPGDTWSAYFEQAFPFARGTLPYDVKGRFLRYEVLDGIRTAVVENTTALTVDLRLNARKLLAASGLRAEFAKGDDPVFFFSGHADLHQTGWIDPSTGTFLKVNSTEEFILTLKVAGIRTTEFPPADVGLNGTLETEVLLLPGR